MTSAGLLDWQQVPLFKPQWPARAQIGLISVLKAATTLSIQQGAMDGPQEPLPYLGPQKPPVGTPCQAKGAPDLIPCQNKARQVI